MPAVTLGFWVIKVAATTLGETGGDAVTVPVDAGAATARAGALVVEADGFGRGPACNRDRVAGPRLSLPCQRWAPQCIFMCS